LFGEEDVEQLVEGIQLDQVGQGVGQFAAVNDADGGLGGFQRTGEAVFDAPFLHDHALLVDGGLGLFTGQRGNILFHQGFEAVEVDVADKGEGEGSSVGETSLVERQHRGVISFHHVVCRNEACPGVVTVGGAHQRVGKHNHGIAGKIFQQAFVSGHKRSVGFLVGIHRREIQVQELHGSFEVFHGGVTTDFLGVGIERERHTHVLAGQDLFQLNGVEGTYPTDGLDRFTGDLVEKAAHQANLGHMLVGNDG